MRSKEFIMKDLYTFDVSLKAAEDTYNSIGECYSNILAKIGINYVKGILTLQTLYFLSN